MSSTELEQQRRDLARVRFEREVAGVEKMQLGVLGEAGGRFVPANLAFT